MIEPKLKAVDLYNKFLAIQIEDGITSEIDMDNKISKKFFELNQDFLENYYKKVAKKSALLAVNEIIRAIPDASDDNSPYNHELKFWKDVRLELEKM
jgi:hypothetical protein